MKSFILSLAMLISLSGFASGPDSLSVTPSQTSFDFTITSHNRPILAFDVYDRSGRLVKSRSVNSSYVTIDRSGLVSGSYLVRLIFTNDGESKVIMISFF